MKAKFSSVWRVAIALALVLSMSLVSAVPVGAANPAVQVTNVADGIDDAQSLALSAAAPPAGTVPVTPQAADSTGTTIPPTGIASSITAQAYNPATTATFKAGDLVTFDIDFDGDGTATDTIYIKATTDNTAVVSVDEVYTDGTLDDNVVTATDDEEITGFDSSTANKDIQIGKHSFNILITDTGAANTTELEVLALTYYEGSFTIDGTGDGNVDDTVYFVLVDTDSDGLYENLELSYEDETYGQGGLADNSISAADDEKLTTGANVVLNNTEFAVAYDAGTDDADPTDDVRITARAYIKSGGQVVDGQTWYVAALDQNSDGVYNVLELSIADEIYGVTTLNGLVSDGDDEVVTAGTVVTMSGADDTKFYVDIVSNPANDPARFELGIEFDLLGQTVTAYVENWDNDLRLDFNSDDDFADDGEDVQYAATEDYLTDTQGLMGTPVNFLTEDYYVLAVTVDSLQVVPVPRAGYTYDVKVLYPDGAGNPVYMEDVGVEAIQPVDSADALGVWNDACENMVTLDADGVGTFYGTYFSAATDLDWADELIEIDTAATGAGTTVGYYEIQPSDYADVVVEVSISEFTYDAESTFTVTVTKAGAALENAYIQVIQDEDGDGNLETGTQSILAAGYTLSDGTKEFTVTPSAAGVMVMKVTKDIAGEETTGNPDDINDIQNTQGQAIINPITLTIETSDMLFMDWSGQPTYTIKLPDDTLFTDGATVWLKGTPLDETEQNTYAENWDEDAYVKYAIDNDGAHDADLDAGEVKSDTTFTPDSTGNVLVKADFDLATDVPEYLGTLTHEVTVAADLNVSVSPLTYDAGVADDLVVTMLGSKNAGPDGAPNANNLNWVKVEVTAPVGQSLATGNYYYDGTAQNLGDADAGDASTVTFNDVLPNDASDDITVTVTGELDDETPVGPVVNTITVSGYVVTNIVPSVDQTVGDVSDISMTVSTTEAVAVNNAKVTITAAAADGFQKDVDDDGVLESFQTITIDGATGEITYVGTGETESFWVNNGYYEVTAIQFAQVGDVEVEVRDAVDAVKAKFLDAFTVLGATVYSLSFEPSSLTAGVDLDTLSITVTEGGVAVTDVATITIDTQSYDVSGQTPADGVYDVNPVRYTEAQTLSVMAKNADETKYGTATLAVELPSLSRVITDAGDVPRDLMLVGAAYDYTIAVTALDALGEPLASGQVWLGTYADEAFTAVDVPPADAMPLVLHANGQGDIAIAQGGEDLLTAGTLVWKVGDSAAVDDTEAALVLEPAITVQDPFYSLAWTPLEPVVDEEITFTVTDNYGDPAGDISVEIVTPAGDVIDKKTTPAGTFKYTAAEAGTYYVYVAAQDAVPVTVYTPAEFVESNLVVDPTEGVAPLTITASADVTNTGGVAGDYTAELKVDGVMVDRQVVSVAAGATEPVSFSYELTDPGTYQVTIDDLTPVAVTALAPLEFTVANLLVGPTEGVAPLTITASADVTNTGGVAGDYTAELKVDGVVVDSQVVSVAAGATETVSFSHELADPGSYQVTIDDLTPVAVTAEEAVVTLQLYEGANPILYTGVTTSLPEALTNISDFAEIIWQRDPSTGGEWWSYLVAWDYGEITQLENGKVYIVVVSQDCIWQLP